MYLSKHGYVIKKVNFTNEELLNIKKELIAYPLSDDKFNKENRSYEIYIETKNKLYIPKMYGIKRFGLPKTLLENYIGKEWLKSNIEFNGSLFPEQIEPVNVLLKNCEENGGGILELATGSGKSICLLYVLSKLKRKTIIIVNKIPLMNQWKSEIEKFLPGIKIGILQGVKSGSSDFSNCDIIIAMLQSMSRIDYPDDLFKDISICCVDEVHNIGSKIFSKILFKLCSKYTIGLSATPNRADGCEYVFKLHIGDIIYKNDDKRQGKPPIIRLLKLDSLEYKENFIINKYTGQKQIQFTNMITDLLQISKRNLLIIKLIKDLIKDDNNRKILVLSERRSHLQYLYNLLQNDNNVHFSYGLFLGSMKQADLINSRNSQCILGTFQAFGEGVSERDLDTLILCSPKKFIGHVQNKTTKNESGKLNQIIGRIFRKDHVERNPIIIDLCDNFSIFLTQYKSRIVFYKTHFKNAIFKNESINLD